MIRSWAHSYRNGRVIIGGQWIYRNGRWTLTWVANNQPIIYKNFYSGHGTSGSSSDQYLYMMPSYGNGQWGDYSGGSEASVCESGQ